MQTRRLLHSIFLLVVLSLLLQACGTKEPVPVTIYYYRRGYVEGGTDAASLKARAIVDAFQKRYPYITVNIIGIPYTPEGTAQLEAALQPVIDFQRAHNVHIYIGEFSAIRWAPGDSACRYLRDVIEIFEEHGWDWSYHAFREWNGWSVEHGPDRNDAHPTAQPTDRQLLLREWFGKNQKPAWPRQE